MLIMLLMIFIPLTMSFAITSQEILDKVDSVQRNYKTMIFDAKMVIFSRDRELTKLFDGYLNTEGDKSFVEYKNPQDQGTRYLKLDQDLWIYLPEAQDVLKISGHLLRDSVMGSDISYNDILDQGQYSKKYNPTTYISTNVNGTNMYQLTLIAKPKQNATYEQLELLVDQKSFLISQIIMFAKGKDSNRAIKQFLLMNYQKFGDVSIAMKMQAKDLRKKNSLTTVEYESVKLDQSLDPNMFTRSYLER